MSQKHSVKYSLVIVAYNHEKFIAQALEGILSQIVNFKYEIIVGDDHSTDATIDIVESYVKKYPDRITLMKTDQNGGLFKNAMRILRVCRGEYLSMMDGDDSWTNAGKLQRQVDFLDNNKEYAGCFHDAEIVQIDTGDNPNLKKYGAYRYYSQFNHYRNDLYPWDLIDRTIIPTCSLVFRSCDLAKQLEPYRDVNGSLDWLAQLMIIRHSKFKYFNETWSVYNNNKGGMTKKMSTKSFVDNNISVLKKLLVDDYYRNLRHHVYESLARESTNMFFLKDAEMSKKAKISAILKYFIYQQKYLFHRVHSLLREL